MKRAILFPVMVAQVAHVSAQQASPGAVEAEKALRARAEQFYQLQVDKKYRQAEAFVAEDTKDLYFANKKSDLLGFTIQKVELLDNNTRAKVTMKAKSTIMMMGAGRLPFEVPTVTLWKIENGQWVWYIDAKAPLETPFGEVKVAGTPTGGSIPDLKNMAAAMPDLDAIQKGVQLDRTTILFPAEQSTATATVSNNMPGFVDVSVEKSSIPGLTVEADKTHVEAGGKAVLTFHRTGAGKISGVVHVSVLPIGTNFDIQVQGN